MRNWNPRVLPQPRPPPPPPPPPFRLLPQHRGFSTCSIMLSGRMEHRDSAGNHGVIGPGGVQWMTAGRGIVHSEMPVVTDGDLHGFQLWVNLPAAQKMSKPWYQDIGADAIPVVAPGGQAGASVRVMAGASGGATGPIKLRNGGLLLDVRLAAGAEWGQEVPPQWNAFAYVYEGGGKLGGHAVDIRHAYVLGNEGTRVQAEAGGGGLRFLLAAGQPINEPIVQVGRVMRGGDGSVASSNDILLCTPWSPAQVFSRPSVLCFLQHGPFVMNTAAEIQQAFADYRNGQLQNPGDDVWKDEEL